MLSSRRLAITVFLGLVCATRFEMSLDASAAAPQILSQSELSVARAAFNDAQNRHWKSARASARQVSDPLVEKFVEWLYLKHKRSVATYYEITNFIDSNRDWPGLNQLRRRAEEAMPESEPDHAVITWFERYPPMTGAGMRRLGEALIDAGQVDRGQAYIREAWIGHNFNSHEEKSFLRAHKQVLTANDHIARLDRLLWDNQRRAARRQVKRVDDGHRKLALARLALMSRAGGVDATIKRVPAALLSDPGLIFERVRWRRRADLDAGAMALLAQPPADLVRPKRWWKERHILARRALADGAITDAYRLAARHGQTGASGIAEAEWLAGWIALRFLDEPALAYQHFTTMHDVVAMPISIARGAYWSGRAAEAAGLPLERERWYTRAASRQTTFYGQLAIIALGRKTLSLPYHPQPSPALRKAFEAPELVRLARMLGELADSDLMSHIVAHLARSATTPVERAMIAMLALDYDLAKVAIRGAKQVSRSGLTVTPAAYPVPKALANASLRPGMPDLGVVLGLARQESELNGRAVSRAGARGLMQLMQATARQVAKQIGVSYKRSRLTSDDAYNIRLGTAYLSGLFKSYQGAQVLAFAAYNAGPGRVKKWIRQNGDPRRADVDVVDWIEMIPFSETRNYVQRVLEGAQVYRHLLADPANPPPLRIVDDMIGGAGQMANR